MAIGTYSELLTAVANWLERTDLTARIPEFIALCESRLNRKLDVRTMQSDNAVTGVVSSRLIALPTGFREPVDLWINRTTGRDPLRFVDPSQLVTSTTSGEPLYWTVDGTNIAFERPCDQAYSFTLRMLGALGIEASTTNYILTNYPDLYLFGTLCEAGPYLKDNDQLTIWDTRFTTALGEAMSKENRNRSLAQLRTDIPRSRDQRSYNIYRDY